MPGFDALYKQAITVFNRVKDPSGEDVLWYPTVITGVHLIVDRSSAWDMNGGRSTDNARLHVRYTIKHEQAKNGIPAKNSVMIGDKVWLEPKEWRSAGDKTGLITFSFGNNDDFDFFMEGKHLIAQDRIPIHDNEYRRGFYNEMNATHDNVFAITGVSKKNLIPHFEITGR